VRPEKNYNRGHLLLGKKHKMSGEYAFPKKWNGKQNKNWTHFS
jgi:hypothetical protein